MRQQGGGTLVMFHDPAAPVGRRGRESLEGARYEALKPLIEVQEYVTSVQWGEGVDSAGFRTIIRDLRINLAQLQADFAGVRNINLSPWLTVPGEVVPHNRIVCARSPRYHNPFGFPWSDLSDTYGDRVLFVGLPAEHEAFEKVVGRPVEHARTENLLDVAKIMAGAPQVVANQSCPLWIAMGLGVKVICEGNPAVPNSEIRRQGSFFAYTQEDMQTLRKAFANVRSRPKD